jgi:hypothetical protein
MFCLFVCLCDIMDINTSLIINCPLRNWNFDLVIWLYTQHKRWFISKSVQVVHFVHCLRTTWEMNSISQILETGLCTYVYKAVYNLCTKVSRAVIIIIVYADLIDWVLVYCIEYSERSSQMTNDSVCVCAFNLKTALYFLWPTHRIQINNFMPTIIVFEHMQP